jgi:hypothetical protein
MKRANVRSSAHAYWSITLAAIFVAGFCAMFVAPRTRAQSSAAPKKLSGPQTKNPAWPYADGYDEVTAAGEFYKVRYEDQHIRLVEVGVFPGAHTPMHGDPYPSVIARDAADAKVMTVYLDPNSPQNGQGAGSAPPPKGLNYPVGMTEAPLAPHELINKDSFPLHYYKVEFKRIDGDDFKDNWKTWYPWMLDPLKPVANIDPRDPKLGPPVSKVYPFAAATESYIAAPNNHFVRYQDEHVVFLEVVFRPGERENIHGHESPSVFARDLGTAPAVSGPTAVPNPPPQQPATNVPGFNAGAGGNWELDPKGINGQGGGSCAPPAGMKQPSCATMGPQWPHAASDVNPYPTHFYRIQFKRVDGDGIKIHWREWYPEMAQQAGNAKGKAAGN